MKRKSTLVERIGGGGLPIGVLYMIYHAKWVALYHEYGLFPPVPTPVAICISIIFILSGVAALLKYPWFSSILFISAFFASVTHTVFEYSRWLIVWNELPWGHFVISGLLFLISIVGLVASIKARKRLKESK